jgi:hypothetical protein
MTDPIRVLLVDDCEPLCAGLERAFARANKRGGGYKLLEGQGTAQARLRCSTFQNRRLF